MSLRGIERMESSSSLLISSTSYFDLPITIIKELIENSLDAKADKISIELDAPSAGLDYCSILDNGIGISQPECDFIGISSNMTSKINTFEDLLDSSFTTFGYRGKALFMLNSLTCKSSGSMKLTTKTVGESFGRLLTITNMIILDKTFREVMSTESGTKIELTHLFKHTYPVRYRVLTQGTPHYMQEIKLMILKFAIIFNNVRFSLRESKNGNKVRELIIPSSLSLTAILSFQFPIFASPRDHFLSIERSVGMHQATLKISIHIQKYHTNSVKIKLLSLNNRIMKPVSAGSIFSKISKEIKGVYKSTNIQLGPTNWIIMVNGIPNSVLDVVCDCSKTNVNFTNNAFEVELLAKIKEMTSQVLISSIPTNEAELVHSKKASPEIVDILSQDVVIKSNSTPQRTFPDSFNAYCLLPQIYPQPLNQFANQIETDTADILNDDNTCQSELSEVFSMHENTANSDWNFSMDEIDNSDYHLKKEYTITDFFKPSAYQSQQRSEIFKDVAELKPINSNFKIHETIDKAHIRKPKVFQKFEDIEPKKITKTKLSKPDKIRSSTAESKKLIHKPSRYKPNYQYTFTPGAKKSEKLQTQTKLDSFFQNKESIISSGCIHREKATLDVSLDEIKEYHGQGSSPLKTRKSSAPDIFISLKEFYDKKENVNSNQIVEFTPERWFKVAFQK